jgi:plastocyanin
MYCVGKRGIWVTGVLIAIVAIITVAAALVGYYLGSGKGGAGSYFGDFLVSISPGSQSGARGAKLTYIVTVTNTGNVSNSYSLGVDWGSLSYKISPSILSIKAGDSENATLTVTVGAVSEVMRVYATNKAGISGDIMFTANVTGKELYSLTTVANFGEGSVALEPAGEQYGPPRPSRLPPSDTYTLGYISGTVVTATATPTTWGYEFDNWSDDASGTATSVRIIMNSDKSITANFREEENMVSIVDFVFQPSSTTVNVGTTVTWKNNGSVTHTITSTSGLFDSGNISPGDNFQFTFENAGTYAYHCSIHTFMTGTVVVQ